MIASAEVFVEAVWKFDLVDVSVECTSDGGVACLDDDVARQHIGLIIQCRP